MIKPSLASLPPVPVFLIALVLTFSLALVDYFTIPYISFSIFYLLAIAFGAWYGGKRLGVFVSVMSALLGLYIDISRSPHARIDSGTPYRDFLVEIVFFFFFTYLLSYLKRALEREHRSARTDELTQIANRKFFMETAENETRRSERYGRPLSLAFMDIDGFKQVNDTQGHAAGDELLRLVAGVIRSGIRSFDLPARLGGDEFAVLLPDTAYDQAHAVILRMRADLNDAMKNRGTGTTFSIGVITCTAPPMVLEDLLTTVDRLMYEVKTAGKNGIRHGICPAGGETT